MRAAALDRLDLGGLGRRAARGAVRRPGPARRRRPGARRPAAASSSPTSPPASSTGTTPTASWTCCCRRPTSSARRWWSRPTTRPSPRGSTTAGRWPTAARRAAARCASGRPWSTCAGSGWRPRCRRAGRLARGAPAGVAVAVALLARLGAFLVRVQGTMTARAVRRRRRRLAGPGPAGRGPGRGRWTACAAAPGTAHALPVGVRATHGLAGHHRRAPPRPPGRGDGARACPTATAPPSRGELRNLAGADAACCSPSRPPPTCTSAPGRHRRDRPGRAGRRRRSPVDGVVDLPEADSLFQNVGAPPGAQPHGAAGQRRPAARRPLARTCSTRWPRRRARTWSRRPRSTSPVAHALPADPAAAYVQVTGAARNLEAALGRHGLVGDNLGAALDAARSDAAYAQMLFLFLGLPGAVLAALLTAAVAGAGARPAPPRAGAAAGPGRRPPRSSLRLAVVEAPLVGVVGAAGRARASPRRSARARSARPASARRPPSALLGWAPAAALAGLRRRRARPSSLPAWRDLRRATVTAAGARSTAPRRGRHPGGPGRAGRRGCWPRGGAGVLADQPATATRWCWPPRACRPSRCHYWAFAGPALLWLGAGLLAWRLADLVPAAAAGAAGRRRCARSPAGWPRPSPRCMSRQRRPAGPVRRAARAGARLRRLDGDVQRHLPAAGRGRRAADQRRRRHGHRAARRRRRPRRRRRARRGARACAAVEPLQHRFAYVGTDLQDLYGVRPATMAARHRLQDAYFQGGTARALMDRLAAPAGRGAGQRRDRAATSSSARRPDQPAPAGRPHQAATRRCRSTTSAWSTSSRPRRRDSFFVANADYVAARTGSDAVGAFLVDTGGRRHRRASPTGSAGPARAPRRPSPTSADTPLQRRLQPDAVDLAALTRVELGFALVLAAAAGGLVLVLGLAERRRTFAIIGLLGARRGSSRALVRAEVLVLAVGGLLTGGLVGLVLARMLVTVLTGVFDPPPAAVTVPWTYLALPRASPSSRWSPPRRLPCAGGAEGRWSCCGRCELSVRATAARRRRSFTTSSTSGISETTTIRAITGSR